MKKICIVTTKWSSINNWIKPFLNEYANRGVDVSIACDMDAEYEKNLKEEFPFVHTFPMPFPRGIKLLGSIKSIRLLTKLFKREKFDMVQYSTPNASMYAAIASNRARIPVRLYCQWGMVYVTMHGMKRRIFKAIERMVCRRSTQIQPDSTGNLEFCRKEGLYDEKKSLVIWNGSAKGLDLTAFDVSKKAEFASEIKEKYDIPEDAPVIGFVGRLGREKGCNELFTAFKALKEQFPSLKLLFVGPIEKEDTIDPELLSYFQSCDDIIKTDRVTNVEKYVSAMDVFVLPTYREGFGMSVVEASAMEVPVVVTKYPGPSSAMQEGVTGVSVAIKDSKALEVAIADLLENKEKSFAMGRAGRQFVENSFEQKEFIKRYMSNRMMLLGLEE
ncbi:MAG: glycosyltransferase family 4 protein [Ruminococcaceae bacterium]|nr:glycosyltransferase family 4 protein [Oscillospiraceae bacterium]